MKLGCKCQIELTCLMRQTSLWVWWPCTRLPPTLWFWTVHWNGRLSCCGEWCRKGSHAWNRSDDALKSSCFTISKLSKWPFYPQTSHSVVHPQSDAGIRTVLWTHIAPIKLAMVALFAEHQGTTIQVGNVLELVFQVRAHAAVAMQTIS